MTFMNAVRAQATLMWKAKTVHFFLAVCSVQWVLLEILVRRNDLRLTGQIVHGETTMLMSFMLGVMMGLLIWREEPPKSRYYHWTLPVDASVHDTARIVAGLAWLASGLALYLGLGFAITALHDVPLYMDRAGAMTILGTATSGLLGYTFVAAISTAFNRPVETIVGGLILIVCGGILADSYRIAWLAKLLNELFGAGRTIMSLPVTVFTPGSRASALYIDVPVGSTNAAAWGLAVTGWLVAATVLIVMALKWNRGRVR